MTAFLVILALAAAWCLFVLASPVGPCTRCQGRRVVRRKSLWGGKGRMVQCPKCRGRGKRPRPLAGAVHRFYQSAAGDRWRDRRKAQLKEDSDVHA